MLMLVCFLGSLRIQGSGAGSHLDGFGLEGSQVGFRGMGFRVRVTHKLPKFSSRSSDQAQKANLGFRVGALGFRALGFKG